MMKPLALALMLSALASTAPAVAQRQNQGNLQIGDPAPDFELYDLAGKNRVRLSSHKGKQPVVLVFGSYT